jgi:hypothetical protein
MVPEKEEILLIRAAIRAIGRALRHVFDSEHKEVPEHLRQLAAKLEAEKDIKREE